MHEDFLVVIDNIGAEKPNNGMAKLSVPAWTPDTTNMVSLLKNNGGVGAHIGNIIYSYGVGSKCTDGSIIHTYGI